MYNKPSIKRDTYEVQVRTSHLQDETIYVVAENHRGAAESAVDFLTELGHSGNFEKIAVRRCLAPQGCGVLVPVEPSHRFKSPVGRVTRDFTCERHGNVCSC